MVRSEMTAIKKNPKKRRPGAGRPTVMTPEVVSKLEMAFSVGGNDTEACAHAGISRETYYAHRKADAAFSDKIDALKEKLPLKAKAELAKLVQAGEPMTVKWYLERKRRNEFGTRQEIDVTTGGDKIEPTRIIFERTRERTESDA